MVKIYSFKKLNDDLEKDVEYKIGYIYKISSKHMKKFYIGFTRTSIQQRFREHKYNRKKQPCSSWELFEYDDVKIEEIERVEYCELSELRDRETYHIYKNRHRVINKIIKIPEYIKTILVDRQFWADEVRPILIEWGMKRAAQKLILQFSTANKKDIINMHDKLEEYREKLSEIKYEHRKFYKKIENETQYELKWSKYDWIISEQDRIILCDCAFWEDEVLSIINELDIRIPFLAVQLILQFSSKDKKIFMDMHDQLEKYKNKIKERMMIDIKNKYDTGMFDIRPSLKKDICDKLEEYKIMKLLL